MEEEVILKRIVKSAGCVILLSAMFLGPNFAFAVEKQATHNNIVKTEKAEKNIKNTSKTSSSEKSAVNNKDTKKTKSAKKASKLQNPSKESNTAVQNGSLIFSIDDCINYALKNDPNIKNYESTQKVQKSNVGQAKSNYFPSITGGTGYNINNTSYFGEMSNTLNNNYYGLSLGVVEQIWDFGRTTAKINMNKYNYEAAGYDLENGTLNTIYTVKIAYTAVLAARANVDIYARAVRINELNYERTKAMYDVGLKSKIDVVNADANLTEARINLLTAQNSYQTGLIELNNSMYYVNAPDYAIKDTETFNFQQNYSVRNEIDVAYNRKNYGEDSVGAEIKDGAILTSGIEKRDILKTYKFKPFALSMDDAIAKAYENRPDLKSLMLVKRAAEESLKVVKRSYYPTLNASGGYSLAKRSDYGYNGVSIYAGLDLPTINAMSIKYQIDAGKSYVDIASNNIDLLKKNIYFGVQTYYVNMKQLEKTIPLMSKKVQQSLENFELADGRYAVGLGNYIELQQAQTDYNTAQLAFVQSVFDYNEARFYLEKSMGIR